MQHLGLYVHIPFCKSKCAYCDFASWAGREADETRYTDALCEEITARAKALGHPAADTVFFGGGTPSLLPAALFCRIAECLKANFPLSEETEWTVECNPGTLTADFVRAMAESGVNRVSMGMQTAQTPLLQALGRIHTLREVEDSAALLRAAGINEINLDLMLGLPGQTCADVAESVRAAAALHPQHISCYALIVEAGTPLHRAVRRGEIVLPDEQTERTMYGLARECLQEQGFAQYEISNFARPGHACRHNVHCWERADYLGFGCAAHSLFRDVRQANPAALDAYLAGAVPETEQIPPEEAMFESMMLGLRLTQGIAEADFRRRHGVELWEKYGTRLARAVNDGRLRRTGGRVYLTEHGMDVMNSVLLELMP